jgi:hypothetical protein
MAKPCDKSSFAPAHDDGNDRKHHARIAEKLQCD